MYLTNYLSQNRTTKKPSPLSVQNVVLSIGVVFPDAGGCEFCLAADIIFAFAVIKAI